MTKSGLRKKVGQVTFTVTSATYNSAPYSSTSNHDPDGESNGTAITVTK